MRELLAIAKSLEPFLGPILRQQEKLWSSERLGLYRDSTLADLLVSAVGVPVSRYYRL